MKKAMNFNNARENLSDLKKAMDKAGIPFWLTAGALLGAIRENDFIGNDNDLDVGIFIDDFHEKSFVENLKAAGFKIMRRLGKYEKNLQYIAKRDGIAIDFYFFYKKKKHMYYTAHFRRGPATFKYTYQKMREYSFFDTKYLIPENPELYLKENYGKQWRIPNKKWTWVLSCNIRRTTLINWLRIARQWVLYYLKLL